MHLLLAFAALGLLVVVLFPFVSKRLRAARRGRAVHLDGSCHWYANYDEDLRYEPRLRSDIIRLTRAEVIERSYRPTLESQVVPRTFRHRVPGDTRVRLWRSERQDAPPLWLCEWAEDPVRVSIGVGEREKVPGVESVPLPFDAWGEAPAGTEMAPEAELRATSNEFAEEPAADGVVEEGEVDGESNAAGDAAPAGESRRRKRRRRRK